MELFGLAGLGFGSGVGVPDYRAEFGLSWSFGSAGK
jgi:hypothetical protein